MNLKAAGMIMFAAIIVFDSLSAYAASGSNYPQRPVRFVVPFTPGASADVIARVIARNLSDVWGQMVVVDNRPGAGAIVGSTIVAKSAPDGYAMLLTTPGHAVNPSLYKNLPYDPIKNFEMVVLLAVTPTILVVHPTLPVEDVKSLVELAKAKPDRIHFGSPGNGTSAHLAGELFNLLANVRLVHIPYKGGAPALVATLTNEIQMLFATPNLTMPQVKNGRLRALAVASERRLTMFPNTPTIAETLPGFESATWSGITVVSGTPRAIVEKINKDVVKLINKSEIKDTFIAEGTEIKGSTPEEFKIYVQQEIARWAKVVKAANIRIE